MPEPTVKQHPNGRWYIHWTDGRRSKRISTGATTLRAARKALAEWLALDRDGLEHDRPLRTCAQVWEIYDRRTAPGRAASWERLKTVFGGLAVADVTDADVEAYVAKFRARDFAQGTVWQDVNYLIASWHAAVKARRLLVTALPRVKRPEKPQPRQRWMTAEEIATIQHVAATSVDEEGRLTRGARFALLALHTGARKHAIETLRWEQVDWRSGGAVIDYQAGMISRRQKRRAVVPVSKTLLPLLQRMHAERRTAFVLDHSGDIDRHLRGLLETAGVAGVTAHTFRHTAATHMVRSGVPIALAANVLGNTAAVVEKTYAKHIPAWLQSAVDSIAGVGADGAQRANLGVENDLQRPTPTRTAPIEARQETAENL